MADQSTDREDKLSLELGLDAVARHKDASNVSSAISCSSLQKMHPTPHTRNKSTQHTDRYHCLGPTAGTSGTLNFNRLVYRRQFMRCSHGSPPCVPTALGARRRHLGTEGAARSESFDSPVNIGCVK